MHEHLAKTFCRVCEPACGLQAVLSDGEITELSPDREHPITNGFACLKGIAALDIHRDPDRLNEPVRREPDGSLTPLSWDTAATEISARLKKILDEDGPNAVGAYVGNPVAFNTLAQPAIQAFFSQLGTRRMFSSGTQDCANKFAGSEAVFGSSTIHPVPDIENTDYLLILGENPRISHMSFLAIANPIAVLKAAKKRGATIRFVNPRRIESASDDVGDVLFIRPDTDVYLLAAMLCEIDRTVGFKEEIVTAHGKNLEGLRQFVRRYPPERAAHVTGIDADEIRRLAHEFATAPRASIHMSTGVNMGRQGTIAYWLLHMLSFVTGNLDRPGGNVLSVGFYPSAKAGRRNFDDGFADTELGRVRKGPLPGNLLPAFIEEGRPKIRALFVIAGNPLLTIGGEEEMRRAFANLELVVCIDLYRNATGEYAHYLLPSTDMLERPDINITGLGLQHRPYVQFTDAVVPARQQRREEWWILGRLAQAMGWKSVLDQSDPAAAVWQRIDHMMTARGLTLAELRALPYGKDFGPHQPGDFVAKHLQTADRRIDCCPTAFAPALERAEEIFLEIDNRSPAVLSLITKRDAFMHNSWFANVERLKPEGRDRNFVYLHPDDAVTRSIRDGQLARVRNAHGEIELPARISDEVMPGVVAITHGWGNSATNGMRVAQKTAGVNVNRLLPSGPGSFELLSNQAHMTGVPVFVEAV